MPDPANFADDWVGKAIAAVIAAPVAVVVTWLTTRRAQKANIETMIVNAAGGLVDRLEKECARVTAECTAMRRELASLKDEHAVCNRRLDTLEREKQALRDRIDGLMDAAPATYGADHAAQGQKAGRAAQRRHPTEPEETP